MHDIDSLIRAIQDILRFAADRLDRIVISAPQKEKPHTLNDALIASINETRYITVQDWNKYHSWPPIAGMRNLIFNSKRNGFATAFKKVGRRVLIDEKEFLRCMGTCKPPI